MDPLFSNALLFFILLAATFLSADSATTGFISIDCGATEAHTDNQTSITWEPDNSNSSSVNLGFVKTLTDDLRNRTELNTLRYFPSSQVANKYCYLVMVQIRRNYLVRTAYIYGNYDGRDSPPEFLEIIDGTVTGFIDTSAAAGDTVFSETVVTATGKTMSVCFARRDGGGDPFVSSIELRPLWRSVYNSTDFSRFALRTVARDNFGFSGSDVFRYSSDPYDRLWNSWGNAGNGTSTLTASAETDVSGFWNEPPDGVLKTALATSDNTTVLSLRWPANQSMPSGRYYVALYFFNIGNETSAFNVSIDGYPFISNLTLTASMAWSAFSASWMISGQSTISLSPLEGSNVGPIINAAEAFQLLPLSGRTVTRDVVALNDIKSMLENIPLDWEGDPCLPSTHGWTGISCNGDTIFRVTALNLTGWGLGGTLSANISKLTALTHIWLGNNNISGPIPDTASLYFLQTLHLENNKLNGSIPRSLAQLPRLTELYLQNNNLTGTVPQGLLNNTNLDLRTSPGNPLLVTEGGRQNVTNMASRLSTGFLVVGLGLVLNMLQT